ncbi:MAG: PEP-CTERM sorting domain-containing protein [Planctomycetes bacterium]|nr:PEP-CTERM sorting domain-containing protein [Planctomycetota bacterium]
MIACLAATGSARADIIVQYNFEASTANASTVHANLSAASPLSNTSSGGDLLSNAGSGIVFQDGAWENDQYWQFSVTVASGWKLSLDSLSFLYNSGDTGFGDIGPNEYLAQYSTDGSTWIGYPDNVHDSLIRNNQSHTATINQAVADLTGTVQFRIQGRGGATDQFLRYYWYLDDVTLNGTFSALSEEEPTAALEPGTLALAALGAIGLVSIAWRRSRRLKW